MQPNSPYSPYAQAPNQYQAPNAYGAPMAAPAMYRQNVFVPYGATAGPLVSPTLRKLKLTFGIAQLVAMFGGIILLVAGGAIGDDVGGVIAVIGGIMLALWYMLLFASAITNAFWMHRFWSWVPPDQRYTSMWKKYISPGTAVGFMFVPYFNIYWLFVVYLGLPEIMERMRVQYPCSKPPAKNIALVTLIVSMLFFPAAPFLQYMFAKHLEGMAAEMQGRMQGAPAV